VEWVKDDHVSLVRRNFVPPQNKEIVFLTELRNLLRAPDVVMFRQAYGIKTYFFRFGDEFTIVEDDCLSVHTHLSRPLYDYPVLASVVVKLVRDLTFREYRDPLDEVELSFLEKCVTSPGPMDGQMEDRTLITSFLQLFNNLFDFLRLVSLTNEQDVLCINDSQGREFRLL
jgi:hypothetical protein